MGRSLSAVFMMENVGVGKDSSRKVGSAIFSSSRIWGNSQNPLACRRKLRLLDGPIRLFFPPFSRLERIRVCLETPISQAWREGRTVRVCFDGKWTRSYPIDDWFLISTF